MVAACCAMSLETILNSPINQQCFIQFACRMATRKGLTAGERDALQGLLEETDSGLFQRFEDAQKGPGILFQAVKEYPIREVTITAPAFIMTNNSVVIFQPIKIGSKFFLNNISIKTFFSQEMPLLNQKMSGVFNKIQTVLNHTTYHRAGKIFEFAFAPIPSEQKGDIFSKLFCCNFTDIGEIQLLLTKYIQEKEEVYNIRTELGYLQPRADNPFQLNLKVDINNRDQHDLMEPAQMHRVWTKADSLLGNHLENIINL